MCMYCLHTTQHSDADLAQPFQCLDQIHLGMCEGVGGVQLANEGHTWSICQEGDAKRRE